MDAAVSRPAAPAAGDSVSSADLARLNFAHHRAYLIGIDAYEKVAPLQTAVSDAQRLAELLAAQHHFSVHPPLIDASGARIRELLRTTLPAEVGRDDRVLFYFAGHGIAADGDDGPAGYLVPADAEPKDLGSFIPMAELQAALDALPCRHLLLVLDCCFSGAFKWSSRHRAIGTLMPKRIYEERFDRFAADPARQIITSAAYDQKALDVLHGKPTGERGAVAHAGDGRAHSPFALALFDALAGDADVKGEREGDGVITATEIYAFIRDRIEPDTLKAGEKLRQTPSFFPLPGHDKGEFMFLHPRHRLNLARMPMRSPYKGLASFDEADRHLFYGRERVIAELRAKADDAECRLLVVVGASGTGKSSVIKAGLLPVLRNAGLCILPVMRPGAHPLHELEQVLKDAAWPADGADGTSPASGAVLMIDQFEEVITRCADPAERDAFDRRLAELLADDARRIARLIITVRSDFEPQVNAGALKAAWFAGRCTVPPFSLDELREVIVMPTIQEVLIFDPPELVDQIIGEVVQSPGALPLLSYALNELYEAYVRSGRSDRALRKDDYDALGGVMGALRTRADTLYRNLASDTERETMRKIMLRMVSVEGELAGRRVAIDDLRYERSNDAPVDTVIEQLVEARLVVRSEDAIEPAHDALVRAWKTLREWIHEAGKDKLILAGRLSMAAQDFERTHDPEFLWHDNPNLPVVERELKNPRSCWFNAREAVFIRRSVHRRKRRAWTLRGIAAGVFVALGGLAVWAWNEKELANGTITEARGFTDHLMFDIVDRLRAIEGTQAVRVELVKQVGQLHGKLSQVGVNEDHSTRFWAAVLEGDEEVARRRSDAARDKYEQAVRIAEARTRDLNWERNLSIGYGKLGELAHQSEAGPDFAAARGWYRKALAIDQRLAGLNNGNRIVQRDLLVSYLRLGHLEKDDNQRERESLLAARGMYEQARAIAERLVQQAPDDVEAHRLAAISLMHLGKVAYALAETVHDEEAARASAMFGAALVLAEQRPEGVLDHASLQYDLCTSYGVLARLHGANGRFDEARNAGRKSLAIARHHAAADPKDAAWQRSHVLGHATLGEIELQAQDLQAARRAYDEALKIARERHAQADPEHSPWAGEIFGVLMQIGEIELRTRHPAAARNAFAEALKHSTSDDERRLAQERIAALGAARRRR